MTPSAPPHASLPTERVRELLDDDRPSVRLQAALSCGTHPQVQLIEMLVDRCGLEPDFFVRDMLTWALTRHPVSSVLPRLVLELESGSAQARSQALHTLSKVGDPRGWAAITIDLLRDPDDDVARSAWRAAVALVPEGLEAQLAETLATQLGRGGREVRLSLSQALAALGEAAVPVLERAVAQRDQSTRSHALATQHLMHHPSDSYETALFEADRITALLGAPTLGD